MPFALVALALVPAIAGSLRLVEVAGGAHVLPANPRITASLVPVVVHIVCAVGYAVLGAFQFSAPLRRRRPVFGTSELTTDLSLGAGWAINLAVPQYVIRRPRSGRTNRLTAQVGLS